MSTAVKERPILFSAPMVRAILAGDKTQTRRVAKPVKHPDLGNIYTPGALVLEHEPHHVIERACPYGCPGDRLWVKETHMAWWKIDPQNPRGPRLFSHVAAFAADGYQLEDSERWIPSIHMRRAASRILLEITGVRVERLQDITDADIEAEGIDMDVLLAAQDSYDIIAKDGNATGRPTLRSAWRDLWESTGGSWAANPWVWVVEFRRIA